MKLDWVIDPTNITGSASDENTGSMQMPLRTYGELARRFHVGDALVRSHRQLSEAQVEEQSAKLRKLLEKTVQDVVTEDLLQRGVFGQALFATLYNLKSRHPEVSADIWNTSSCSKDVEVILGILRVSARYEAIAWFEKYEPHYFALNVLRSGG